MIKPTKLTTLLVGLLVVCTTGIRAASRLMSASRRGATTFKGTMLHQTKIGNHATLARLFSSMMERRLKLEDVHTLKVLSCANVIVQKSANDALDNELILQSSSQKYLDLLNEEYRSGTLTLKGKHTHDCFVDLNSPSNGDVVGGTINKNNFFGFNIGSLRISWTRGTNYCNNSSLHSVPRPIYTLSLTNPELLRMIIKEGSGSCTLPAIGSKAFASKIKLLGSGDMQATSITGSSVDMDCSGSGDINVDTIDSESTCYLKCTGSGDMRATSITGSSVDMDCSGSAGIDIDKIKSEGTCYLKCTGAGDISVGDVTAKELTINSSGAGDFQVSGSVDQAEVFLKGAGDVNLRGLKVPKGQLNYQKKGVGDFLLPKGYKK